ncbi:MAG TPA: hypothetical protein VKC89_01850 [Patescibacteria group bacterium]|nr:hypothetical protein [Patescibacteria group bacterium]
MTLDQAAEKTKVFLKFSGILLGLVFVLFVGSKIFSAIFPAAAPPPEVSFGKLYSPDFPNSPNKTFSYTLETISGRLPTFQPQVKVFKMATNTPDLLALSKAQALVSGVGFNNSPAKISDNIYQWRDSKSSRILTMNIQDLNFNMISDFLSNPNQPFFPKEVGDATKTAENFLTGINLMPGDLDPTKTQASLFSIKNYSLVPATSLSNAQAIQVSFFQKPFNNLPIYYLRTAVSTLNFLVGGVGTKPEVVEANYFYQKPSSESSTYPIKTANVAFEDLKKGKVYIASSGSGDKVSIKNISLGYYMSEKKQDYLLPIVVFEGNDGFMAYEFAVTDEWVNK